LVASYLQKTEVAIVVNNNLSSVTAAKGYDIPIPAVIPTNMIIAVRPSANSQDKFWLARVTDLRSEQPLTYNIRYFLFNKNKKAWGLMKGAGAYGWVAHTAIIAAGIEFNNNNSMKASSVKLIAQKINQD
jgi:hypothetical protein